MIVKSERIASAATTIGLHSPGFLTFYCEEYATNESQQPVNVSSHYCCATQYIVGGCDRVAQVIHSLLYNDANITARRIWCLVLPFVTRRCHLADNHVVHCRPATACHCATTFDRATYRYSIGLQRGYMKQEFSNRFAYESTTLLLLSDIRLNAVCLYQVRQTRPTFHTLLLLRTRNKCTRTYKNKNNNRHIRENRKQQTNKTFKQAS